MRTSGDNQDLELVGLGPSSGEGWLRSPDLVYQCTRCNTVMPADINEDFACECGAMGLDFDAGRFGSRFGDQAIRVYRRIK